MAHAKRGDKIAAIKITREHTGLSLKEAKEAVEAYLKNPGPQFAAGAPVAAQPENLPRAAITALEHGRLIEAVKHVRQTTGSGLKDARETVARHLADNPAVHAKFKAAASAEIRRVAAKFCGFACVLGLVTLAYFLLTGQL